MARKFFNQKVRGSSNKTIAYAIVGGVLVAMVIFIFMVVFTNQSDVGDPIIEIRDLVTVEVNSELPDKTLFFAELQNVDEDDINISFADVDLSKVGDYPIEINLYGETYDTKLSVVDTVSPEIHLKNYNIPIGGTYKPEDFVDSCTDNSGEECTIEFYDLAKNQDGNPIDYSTYTDEGTYTIQIVASDSSGNTTTPDTVILVIGESDIVTPSTCNYGNSVYDSNTYILGVNVTENGCALDLNLYQDESITAAAYELLNQDTDKIKKEVAKLNINASASRTLNQVVSPVLNTTGTGLVGYTVHQELTITYEDGSSELIASYYINTDGSRTYSINKYNLS